MKRTAVIKPCRKEDIDPDRPKSEQKVCLYTHDGKRLLGRHPDAASAERQERAVQVNKHGSAHAGVTRMSNFVRLAEVPESAVKGLYQQDWGVAIQKAVGDDLNLDSKTAQWLFYQVWDAVIQLMDKALAAQKVDVDKFEKNPEYVKDLAAISHVITDNGIKAALGIKGGGLDAANAPLENLMKLIGKQAPADTTLKALAQQARPLINQQFDRITEYLKQQKPEQQTEQEPAQKAASAESPCACAQRLAAKWKGEPKGWDEGTKEKFWESLTGEHKDKITACIKKLKGTDITDPGAFCASLARELGHKVPKRGPAKEAGITHGAMRKAKEEMDWAGKPHGWNKKTMLKFWNSLTGDHKKKVEQCIHKMSKAKGIDDPGAFCASLARSVGKYHHHVGPESEHHEQHKTSSARQAGQPKQPEVTENVKEFFKKLPALYKQQKQQAELPDKPEKQASVDAKRAWRRLAIQHRRQALITALRKADAKLQLPTTCIEQLLGARYSNKPTTTFEKQGDEWFVEGVNSNGVVDDTLVNTMKSYCEMQTTASVARTAKRKPWSKHPHGWNRSTEEEFWQSLTGGRQHKIQACIDALEDSDIDDPGAFCASLARKLGHKVPKRGPAKASVQRRAEVVRGFDLSKVGEVVRTALSEIMSDPETYQEEPDRYEVWAGTVIYPTTGDPKPYGEVLEIPEEEMLAAERGYYEWDLIDEAKSEVDDAIRKVMQAENLPGYLALADDPNGDRFGLMYGIDADELRDKMGEEDEFEELPPHEASTWRSKRTAAWPYGISYEESWRTKLAADAIAEYGRARAEGLDEDDAAQAAWMEVKRDIPKLRAPRWDEALALNTSRRRSYRLPLGEVLGVSAGDYGQHCAYYPRTRRSECEVEAARQAVLAYLESQRSVSEEMPAAEEMSPPHEVSTRSARRKDCGCGERLREYDYDEADAEDEYEDHDPYRDGDYEPM